MLEAKDGVVTSFHDRSKWFQRKVRLASVVGTRKGKGNRGNWVSAQAGEEHEKRETVAPAFKPIVWFRISWSFFNH